MKENLKSKINLISEFIEKNSSILNLEMVNQTLNESLLKLKTCIIPDESISSFFNQKNFKTIESLQKFSSLIFKSRSSSKKRKDIMKELTLKSMEKGFTKNYLITKLREMEPIKIKPEKKIKEVKKPKKPKIKIEDQVNRWINMSIKAIENELNDLTRYPTPKSLKLAANSILKQEDKRLRKREKIVQRILNRIEEDKSIISLGMAR